MRTSKTWLAAKAAGELAERKAAERDPMVAAVLASFPGAQVVAVRKNLDNGEVAEPG